MNEHHLADKTSLLLFIFSVNLIRTQDGRSIYLWSEIAQYSETNTRLEVGRDFGF